MPEPEPLIVAEMNAYEQRLAEDLSGEEQAALRERDPRKFTAWLDTQLLHVPMPSRQKPEINGFHEGDRVRLTQPFEGEAVSYEAGRTGTFLITNTAPAQIRLARTLPLYEILVDGPDGRLIGVSGGAVERIRGQFQVTYNGEYVTCSPVGFANGERVELDRDCEIDGALYAEGTAGTVILTPDPKMRARLASEDRHAIILDKAGLVVLPGAILRPIKSGTT